MKTETKLRLATVLEIMAQGVGLLGKQLSAKAHALRSSKTVRQRADEAAQIILERVRQAKNASKPVVYESACSDYPRFVAGDQDIQDLVKVLTDDA